jgi:ParB family chromosome partitioning protein
MAPQSPRGLSSLLSSSTKPPPTDSPHTDPARVIDIPLSAVAPSPNQPRRTFDPKAIESLAASIRAHGLLQPIVVRPTGDHFELIAGERRWRAAKIAALETVRAICRQTDDATALTLSLIENLQREDLDPIEEASAYKAMVDSLALTHEQIASYVGRDRSTIANQLRLLELPPAIQAKLIARSLSPGHARVLLAVSDPTHQASLADRVISTGMSVRALERIVYGNSPDRPSRQAPPKSPHLLDLERRISERLGLKVQIHEGARGGKLILRFRNNAEFMSIVDALGVSQDPT